MKTACVCHLKCQAVQQLKTVCIKLHVQKTWCIKHWVHGRDKCFQTFQVVADIVLVPCFVSIQGFISRRLLFQAPALLSNVFLFGHVRDRRGRQIMIPIPHIHKSSADIHSLRSSLGSSTSFFFSLHPSFLCNASELHQALPWAPSRHSPG